MVIILNKRVKMLEFLTMSVCMLNSRLSSRWLCFDEVYVVSHIRDLKSWM